MLKEHDQVVLTTDLEDDEDLKAGDVGVIVHIHRNAEAFEVEFFAVDGTTITVATVLASRVRPVTDRDRSHARPADLPASVAPKR